MKINTLKNLIVEGFVASPLGGEAELKAYIVATNPSGAFGSFTPNSIAILMGGNWREFKPQTGYKLYHKANKKNYVYNGIEWFVVGGEHQKVVDLPIISGNLIQTTNTPTGDKFEVEVGFLDSNGNFVSENIAEVVDSSLTLSTNAHNSKIGKVEYLIQKFKNDIAIPEPPLDPQVLINWLKAYFNQIQLHTGSYKLASSITVADIPYIKYLTQYRAGIDSIPRDIGLIPNLLQIDFNLGGNIPASDFSYMPNTLNTLRLNNVGINGALPSSIYNMLGLTTLYITNQALTSVSSQFKNLTELTFIDFTGCQLTPANANTEFDYFEDFEAVYTYPN